MTVLDDPEVGMTADTPAAEHPDARDPRHAEWAAQRKARGWDDRETWSLDVSLAAWLAPRLKRLAEVTSCHPDDVTFEDWVAAIKKAADALEWYHTSDFHDNSRGADVRAAIEFVAARFEQLWW